ncbi:Polynucleotide 5'-hydroxyl-kinase NOL9 [Capsicum baccatum]|uniref:Polynucleotide 5'-hydroxyl-kinase NOL9 n=1 Tax=Capsicum baccatum TaxID=33114 RepID=A0A2G2WRJ2_CAPBA|nr:Polynucleotide 5'-hydroxyl-kinase NOL9 [Capsicum baccatum]
MASVGSGELQSANIFIPQEWSDAADTISYDSNTSPAPVALVCGPKNSGKTTLSRLLVNVLLQRYKKVAYLDTDVGQTEFTPPGLLSLTTIDKITSDLSIPCLKTPERCFFFGDISSKRDPKTYLACIFALYDHYRKTYLLSIGGSPGNAAVPLVINTTGWVKGKLYLLSNLFRLVWSLFFIYRICISAVSKNLPAGAFWLDDDNGAVATLIEVNSARQDSFNRSVLVQKDARLLRDLRVMAYFRQCFPSDMKITTIKELSRALAAHPPYEILISSIKIKHLHCEVPKSEVFYSLNATIVGLAVDSEDSENFPDCVGLGIVRAIDTFKHVLYVITPVPKSSLQKVDLLLQGFIEIPTCLLQVQGCTSPYMSADVLPSA